MSNRDLAAYLYFYEDYQTYSKMSDEKYCGWINMPMAEIDLSSYP